MAICRYKPGARPAARLRQLAEVEELKKRKEELQEELERVRAQLAEVEEFKKEKEELQEELEDVKEELEEQNEKKFWFRRRGGEMKRELESEKARRVKLEEVVSSVPWVVGPLEVVDEVEKKLEKMMARRERLLRQVIFDGGG